MFITEVCDYWVARSSRAMTAELVVPKPSGIGQYAFSFFVISEIGVFSKIYVSNSTDQFSI